jgi:hypothetical protein
VNAQQVGEMFSKAKNKAEDAYDWIIETEPRRTTFCCVMSFVIGFAVGKL